MYDYAGWIVRSDAGRDKGGIFFVVGVDQEKLRLLLADGKRRRISHPKEKKLGHVWGLTDPQHERCWDHPVVHKLIRHEPVTDNEIRRALAAFRAKEV